MFLPLQASPVNRTKRLSAAHAAHVSPAFLGTALYLLGKAGIGAVKGVLS